MKLKGVKNNAIEKKKNKYKNSLKKVVDTKPAKDFKIRNSFGTFSSTPLQTYPQVSLKSNVLTNSLEQNKSLREVTFNETSMRKEKKKSIFVKNDILELNNELKQTPEREFKINNEDIENAIIGVLTAREKNPKLQNQLFEERSPIFLHISCHKIPKGYNKLFRIPLKHSVLTEEDEICLIVSEVKGIENKDHEKHIEYYENLLKTKGVNNIKKIMTCHEFRTEYETFEQKLRLVDHFEAFLVDGKVSGKIVHKCGKIFYKKRKVPTPIKLQATQLKDHIDKSLLKVILNLHLKGNGYTVQFGHTKMNLKDLVANVDSVINFLDEKFPKKFDNIKGIHIFAPRAISIPIYMSMKNPENLNTPVLKSKKPKAYKTYTGELTTLSNATVTVKPSGKVIVHRHSKYATGTADDKITDKDIIESNKNKDKNQGKDHKNLVKIKHVMIKKSKKINKDVEVRKVKEKVDSVKDENGKKVVKNKKKITERKKKKVDGVKLSKLNILKNKKRALEDKRNNVNGEKLSKQKVRKNKQDV